MCLLTSLAGDPSTFDSEARLATGVAHLHCAWLVEGCVPCTVSTREWTAVLCGGEELDDLMHGGHARLGIEEVLMLFMQATTQYTQKVVGGSGLCCTCVHQVMRCIAGGMCILLQRETTDNAGA